MIAHLTWDVLVTKLVPANSGGMPIRAYPRLRTLVKFIVQSLAQHWVSHDTADRVR